MVRDPPLDPPPTRDAAAAADAALGRGVEAVTPIAEGLNAVYRVTLSDGTDLVLKAATLATDDEFLPEPRVLSRVARETSVPVPEVVATVGPSDSPLGVAYYLAEFCEGRTVPDVRSLSPGEHERLVATSGRHLAAFHGLQVGEGDGFGDLRVADGGLEVVAPSEWPAFFQELAADRVTKLRGEGVVADADAPFADLATDVERAFDGFARAVGDQSVAPVPLHGDYRPANLVLAAAGESPLLRAVLDVGGQVGDGLLDLALAESSLVDVPLGGGDHAPRLRRSLRESYREHRTVDDAAFATRYPYYRLYALVKCMAGFDYFEQFAPGDEASVEARWRSAATELLGPLA